MRTSLLFAVIAVCTCRASLGAGLDVKASGNCPGPYVLNVAPKHAAKGTPIIFGGRTVAVADEDGIAKTIVVTLANSDCGKTVNISAGRESTSVTLPAPVAASANPSATVPPPALPTRPPNASTTDTSRLLSIVAAVLAVLLAVVALQTYLLRRWMLRKLERFLRADPTPALLPFSSGTVSKIKLFFEEDIPGKLQKRLAELELERQALAAAERPTGIAPVFDSAAVVQPSIEVQPRQSVIAAYNEALTSTRARVEFTAAHDGRYVAISNPTEVLRGGAEPAFQIAESGDFMVIEPDDGSTDYLLLPTLERRWTQDRMGSGAWHCFYDIDTGGTLPTTLIEPARVKETDGLWRVVNGKRGKLVWNQNS